MLVDRRSRGLRGVVVFWVVGLMACLVGWVSPVAAQVDQPPPGEEQLAPDGQEQLAPESEGEPPPDGEPTAEEMQEIQATVEATVNEAAAGPEQDAASAFLTALFMKLAELQNRYGNAAGPGERIPQSALDGISWELRTWLEPYARQMCDGKLVLDGISDQIAERIRVRTWMYFVPPILLIFLGVRKGVCVKRLLDSAPAFLPAPCALAKGHDAADWYWETSNGFSGGPFPNDHWAAWTEMFRTVPDLSLVWEARNLPGAGATVFGHTYPGPYYCVHD
jgi:hypothetical protein